ncbi:MAG: two-component response regulator [Methanomethylovorans sp. PtaU1.Bin093]|jgi:CheY-like chemotaxis protein|uniref:response regulator n=1 Tax=Methanomethylovorans sp. PtaU1.Bin093 TaxID=1811679 RepID=UPI0009C76978|nr:response regulator [Methanomethylovorans sp. PtaU1.Bin093]OPY21137.1 MAG: two-component response regulator [Methanomethylovorans sp. PtaU1.Bin093]
MMGVKILVVEDENIVALEIKKRLQKLGYIVPGVASTGEDAISKAEGILPDLVLMDIMLKGEIDGINAAGEIRKRFNIPVIYLTAYSDGDTIERAKLTEPYGYILKPFEEDDLRTAIEIALYRHQMVNDREKKK